MVYKSLMLIALMANLYEKTGRVQSLRGEFQDYDADVVSLSNHNSKRIWKIESISEAIPLQQLENQEAIANFLYVKKILFGDLTITTIKTSASTNLPFLKPGFAKDNKITIWGLRIVTYCNQQWDYDVKQWLSLKHNSIRSLVSKSFARLPNLLYINLGHNQIACVDEGAFEGLYRLEILDLSYNRIHSLFDSSFAALGSLQVLNLYNNDLSYISHGVLEHLKGLKELVVLFNPWQCGCYSKIIIWAHKASVGVKNAYLKCARTSSVDHIPNCVITRNLTGCALNVTLDFSDVLRKQIHFRCRFQYESYLNVNGYT